MEFLIPIGIGVAFLALMLYSLGLQRRGVRAQGGAINSMAESTERQKRAEVSMEESLKLQRRSNELSEQILAELQKANDRK